MQTTTPLDLEIRSRLARVLSGEVALRDFYYWFIPATWDIAHTEGEETIRLSYQLTHLFAELTSGDLTLREVKQELEQALSTYMAMQTPWNEPARTNVVTSSLNDITEDLAPVFVLGLPRVVAHA